MVRRVLPRHAEPRSPASASAACSARSRRSTPAASARRQACCRSAASTRRGAPARRTPGRRRRCTCCSRPATAATYKLWKQYSKAMQSRPPIHLRDLLDFKPLGAAGRRSRRSRASPRSASGSSRPACRSARSGPEAHKTLNIAMNRIGAKSDSGEGGEDPAHFLPMPNGDNPSAKIKQVASGRFGVTAEYLNPARSWRSRSRRAPSPARAASCPGMKVTELIARLRHSTPGVTLISPPPHHDIYSIEDLAQLIYDLKQINPRAKVCVKLVQPVGRRHHRGGRGQGQGRRDPDLGPQRRHRGLARSTSIKYAGLPWEMGLTEAHQVLTMNNLRERVIAAHRRRAAHRARHRDGGDAGGRGVRHRHRGADRHGLHHGAPVPVEHLPGRASAPRTRRCAPSSPARRTRWST